MLTVAFLCFLVKVLHLFTADHPKPSLAPPPASRPAVSYCLSLMISSRGLAPPKIFEFGLATWLSGSATVRGFSCSRGRCARSSIRNKVVTSIKYYTVCEILLIFFILKSQKPYQIVLYDLYLFQTAHYFLIPLFIRLVYLMSPD